LLAGTASAAILTFWSGSAIGQTATDLTVSTSVTDPGVRGGAPGAGGQLPGLTTGEAAFFALGKEDFERPKVGDGLGPRFVPTAAGLPFAARDRRHQPGGQSAGRRRDGVRGRNVVPSSARSTDRPERASEDRTARPAAACTRCS
jgi:hypothetical protein